MMAAYRVQLPERKPDPADDFAAPPEVKARRTIAVNAFADLFRRLAPVFPDGLDGLDVKRPDIWAQIALTERTADRLALDYIAA
jgi:hypothetical protein